MKTEEILKELTDITNRIEEIKKQIKKPELTLNKWYKYSGGLFNYQGLINGVIQAFGIRSDGTWLNTVNCGDIFCMWIEATTTEVQEALKKEVVKKYTTKKVKCLLTGEPMILSDSYYYDFNCLWNIQAAKCDVLLMNTKGIWAEPIKTMTVRELAQNLNVSSNILKYLTENKTQIIEILNSI